jgi:hypothetical protein
MARSAKTNSGGGSVTKDLKSTYTISEARYAKGKMAIHCKPDGSGWKTLTALIIDQLKGVRYSNRERAYIVSPGCAKKFEQELAAAEAKREAYRLIREAHSTGRAVQHVGGDPTNNDLANLRIVTLKANL